ncbi:hypothetical protein B296_00034314, partial [Ensete ventricosum]
MRTALHLRRHRHSCRVTKGLLGICIDADADVVRRSASASSILSSLDIYIDIDADTNDNYIGVDVAGSGHRSFYSEDGGHLVADLLGPGQSSTEVLSRLELNRGGIRQHFELRARAGEGATAEGRNRHKERGGEEGCDRKGWLKEKRAPTLSTLLSSPVLAGDLTGATTLLFLSISPRRMRRPSRAGEFES